MSAIRHFTGIAGAAALGGRPLHLAVGMFDGVHLGHRAVIEAAVRSARGGGAAAGVLTFRPHPSALLQPGNPTRLMQDSATQARVLGRLGMDVVITQPFTREFAMLEAGQFLPWLRSHLHRLEAIHVGENFRFGRGRQGDVPLLKEAGRALGLRVFSAPRVNLDGEPVSSTRVRERLQAGDIGAVNALLGYIYFSAGRVAGGRRLGRELGFPTLNLDWSPGLPPRFGVYAVRVAGGNTAGSLPAVANYGVRPTVDESKDPRLEVHVLGDCPWGEGDEVTVEWLAFLRPEMKFAGVAELREQIARDRDVAAAFLRR
ncbi:MAG: riboflavin biosynthesis protein RibF [Opitutus sp.]